MDQIKLLVKDVLHKIQDIPDVPFTPIRMSEIASESSVSTPPSRSASEQSMSAHHLKMSAYQEDGNDTTKATFQKDEVNGNAERSTHIFPHVVEIIRNPAESNDVKSVYTEYKASHDSLFSSSGQSPGRPKMESNGTEHISTLSSNLNSLYIGDKGSHDSLYSVPNHSPKLSKTGKPTSRIVMGKRALLRSRSAERERHPAAVVHDLVNVHEKYHDKILHYIGRMYHRRMSRESRSTDDDGTNSNYSGSSLRTLDSLYDGKSYFSLFFPQRSEGDLDFLQSTDDLNKDTTDELFNSTVNSTDAKDTSADNEYDPKKFLKSALGDISFDSQSMDISTENGRLKYSQSADPVIDPSLLSKAGSLYSSVRKSIRRACSFRDKNGTGVSQLNKSQRGKRCQSFTPDCFNSAENLMRELYVQNGIIFQVSKALTFCRNSKDVTSPEYIEAEKILLVASCHKEAIQAALDATEFGEKEHRYQKYNGTLEISDLIYYLKGNLSTEQTNVRNFDEYFVVVVTCGRVVLSSKVLVADKNGEVKLDKMFRLTGLRTDFEVSVAIYSMMVKHVDRNHDKNIKHNKKDRKLPCPSTRSFFNSNHHKSSRRSLLVDNIPSIKPSSFTLWGSCTIRCSDLQKTHFRMHHVPLCSSLEGYFTTSLNGDVKLSNRSRGFLSIGLEDKGHLIWNRRWCVLEGSLLKYWNYPSEECGCDPVGVINLAYATEKTSPADRSICPRPKSLCLLVKNKEGLVLKYFLSADSLEEKRSWQEEINFVIATLESWKCLGLKENK